MLTNQVIDGGPKGLLSRKGWSHWTPQEFERGMPWQTKDLLVIDFKPAGDLSGRAGAAMASSGVFIFTLLACLLNGICVAFNMGVVLEYGIARIPPHIAAPPRKACNLRMQDESTNTGVTRGFSNRREQQKADALLRQKSKQSKMEKMQSEEPIAEPVSAITEADVATETAPLRRVSNPKALEKLKDSARLEKEKRLMAAKQAGLPMIDRVGQGLPLIEKVLTLHRSLFHIRQ